MGETQSRRKNDKKLHKNVQYCAGHSAPIIFAYVHKMNEIPKIVLGIGSTYGFLILNVGTHRKQMYQPFPT